MLVARARATVWKVKRPRAGSSRRLGLPSTVGATRTGGIHLNKPRIQAVLAAALALAPTPGGFTVAELAAKVSAMAGPAGYITQQTAYDLSKLRGKNLIIKPGRTRRYQVPRTPSASSLRCSPSATT